MRLAWTVDDAPTIAAHGPVAPNPLRMDRVREALVSVGVRHCVAFVIGAHAEGHEGVLQRWLQVGFELGNHTFEHDGASLQGPDALLRSIERCDRLLKSVGAFDGRSERWFRFPYLDRGADVEARLRIAAGVRDVGYRLAHASVDTFDHHYEAPLGRALIAGDERLAQRVEGRYLRAAQWGLRLGESRGRRLTGRSVTHVGYGHFGLLGERCTADLITRQLAQGTHFVSLAEAMADPLYAAFEKDPTRSGLVTAHGIGLAERALGWALRAARCFNPTGRSVAGPYWPFLDSRSVR